MIIPKLTLIEHKLTDLELKEFEKILELLKSKDSESVKLGIGFLETCPLNIKPLVSNASEIISLRILLENYKIEMIKAEADSSKYTDAFFQYHWNYSEIWKRCLINYVLDIIKYNGYYTYKFK